MKGTLVTFPLMTCRLPFWLGSSGVNLFQPLVSQCMPLSGLLPVLEQCIGIM
jgi:hypothetical protein